VHSVSSIRSIGSCARRIGREIAAPPSPVSKLYFAELVAPLDSAQGQI
jgi:hypothetical protein